MDNAAQGAETTQRGRSADGDDEWRKNSVRAESGEDEDGVQKKN
ncbi:hypothetical protein ANO11243_014800 [Dothideomycetidae sp. 11243]|nr:hypothetical protein ANO11243_014800 [fungal sp. No.11243]